MAVVAVALLTGLAPTGAATAAAPAVTRISVRATPTTVKAGATVLISGSVTPRVTGVPVVLQRLSGRRWLSLRSVAVSRSGSFTTVLRTSPVGGTWALRVARIASSATKAGASATISVIIRKPAAPAPLPLPPLPPLPPPPPPPALTITTKTLPNGAVGRVYKAVLSATGGTGPYTWKAGTGGVPSGMGLTKDGLLFGYPTVEGKTTVRVIARTAGGSTGTATLSVGIAPAPAGKVLAWGLNNHGQLGNKSSTASAVPAAVGDLSRIIAVAAAGESAYALESDGTLWAWGRGDNGRLGNSQVSDYDHPVRVKAPPGITAIAVGGAGGYALKSDGTVWAWGKNDIGQFGNDTNTDSYVPAQVSLTGAVAIAGATWGGYAIKGDGTVWAWGDNRYGQLGTGSAATRALLPVQITRLKGIVAIAPGFLTSYALGADGSVWAWGAGTMGELGDGTLNPESRVPVRVSQVTDATAIAGGVHGGYALRSDGTVVGWGANANGELGNGTKTSSAVPVQVSGLTGIRAISAGQRNGYALTSTQQVLSWGDNTQGQLANSSVATGSLVPVPAAGLPAIAALSANNLSGYAVTNEPV